MIIATKSLQGPCICPEAQQLEAATSVPAASSRTQAANDLTQDAALAAVTPAAIAAAIGMNRTIAIDDLCVAWAFCAHQRPGNACAP
jgi:hypothetical protein